MNNGIIGSMMAVTSNSPRDALGRLEVMCMMSEPEWPPRTIRQVIASAVNIIVQQDKMRDGSRKIVKVTEVQGMEGDQIITSDIFEFGRAMENGIEVERLQPTGSHPKVLDRIEDFDWKLPPSIWPE
jgi:pilus assembly protein CpaF